MRERFEAVLDIGLSGSAVHSGERVHAIAREAAEVFGAVHARLQILQKAAKALPEHRVELSF